MEQIPRRSADLVERVSALAFKAKPACALWTPIVDVWVAKGVGAGGSKGG